MKIISCRFKNINSIKGESPLLDFDKGLLGEAGLFAIIGPTGSGKTTVLDAISVALYGQTPRLPIGNVGELMTRHTNECYSEVEFTARGKRYRSHWSMRHSRNGNLLAPKMELVELTGGLENIIEEKKSLVVTRIEEITGLDFNRFTRSILLAQGNFAAFLNAKEKEQADLLEKMTGTEIYSRISTLVYERYQEEKKLFDELVKEKEGVDILSSGEIEELEKKSLTLREEIDKLKGEEETIRKQKDWLGRITRLAGEIEECEKALALLREQEEAMGENLRILQLSEKASLLKESFSPLSLLRENYITLVKGVEELSSLLPVLEGARADRHRDLEEALRNLEKQREEQKAREELIGGVVLLDQSIAEKSRLYNEEKKEERTLAAYWGNYEEQEKKKQEERNRLEKEHRGYKEFLEKEHSWKIMERELSLVLSRLEKLKENRFKSAGMTKEQRIFAQQKTDLLPELEKNKERLGELTHRIEELEKNLPRESMEQEEALEKDQTRLRELLQLDQQIKERKERIVSLEQKGRRDTGESAGKLALLEKELEQEEVLVNQKKESYALQAHRNRLEEGQPCPLCGSLSHPWEGKEEEAPPDEGRLHSLRLEVKAAREEHSRLMIEKENALKDKREEEEKLAPLLHKREKTAGESLSPGEVEQKEPEVTRELNRLRVARRLREKQTGELKNLQEEKHHREIELHNLENRKETLEKEIATREKNLKEAGDERSGIRTLLEEPLSLVGEPLPQPKEEDALAGRLKLRGEEFTAAEKKKEELEQKLAPLREELRELGARKEEYARNLARSREILEERKKNLRQEQEKRQDLFGSLDPGEEKIKLEQETKARLQVVRKTEEDEARLSADLEGQRKLFQIRNEELHKLEQRKEDLEKKFVKELAEQGFDNEEEFSRALLSREDRARLQEAKEQLDRKKIETLGQKKDKHTLLAKEQALALTEKDVPTLEEEEAFAREEIENRLKEQGKIRGNLEQQAQQQEKLKKYIEKIEGQKKEKEHWAYLNELIGSKGGDKFRKFAQGLTLELLINLANNHLAFFSDRYKLHRSQDLELGLEVIDTYQADAHRPTKTLSGGESFLISLSLALGLSQISSRKTNVDSLFLDEGFGTLDAETLETALAALHNIRATGKTIGIISHVEMLKERIPVQIQLIKKAGGLSFIRIEEN